METGGKMFVGHLWAFSPRIMMMMITILSIFIAIFNPFNLFPGATTGEEQN